MRIGLDFDGVVYGGPYTTRDAITGGPVDGAMVFIGEALAAGHEVVVITSRLAECPAYLRKSFEAAFAKWLTHHFRLAFPGYPVDAPGVSGRVPVTGEKVACDVYIDDRAWRFDAAWGWPELGEIGGGGLTTEARRGMRRAEGEGALNMDGQDSQDGDGGRGDFSRGGAEALRGMGEEWGF